MLKAHPQHAEGGFTFTLYPYLKESNDTVVSQDELHQFTASLQKENPTISFDYNLIDQFEYPDLWFLEILADENLREQLRSKFLKYAYSNGKIDMNKIYPILGDLQSQKIDLEGDLGLYNRAQ